MTTRRELLIAFGGVLAAPLIASAQQPGKTWRVGFLAARHVNFVDSDIFYGPFRQGMRELGYVEGKNLIIEWRSAEGKYERLPGLVMELVNAKVDVIVVAGNPAAKAAQKMVLTLPVVIGNAGDPVEGGFVKSLARPGGNITGLSNMTREVSLKQLEMLLEMVPRLSRVAVLMNSTNTASVKRAAQIEIVAQSRGLKILQMDARTPQEIDHAFAALRQQKAGALMVLLDSLFVQQKDQIAALTAERALPAIAYEPMYPEAGMLMSYGPSQPEMYRRAATYVDKLFKGAKPADLPVEQPTKFDLVINGKTARALGLKIPPALLIRANRVIE